MNPSESAPQLTPSSEVLTPEEATSIAPYFTNTDRSVVALVNLPEVSKAHCSLVTAVPPKACAVSFSTNFLATAMWY